MDPLTLLAGGGLVFLGGVAGRALRPRPPKPAEPLVPECSCGHGFGSHDKGGECAAEVKRPSRWSLSGSHPVDFDWVPCSCLSYDGPEPLPRVWTP